jgi:hypothetical protein
LFQEREVSFGLPDWQLPGTLAIPKQDGRSPAVVLVHGSGPQDRDETVGGMRMFRDLAEGLASRGIVALRYDKRTRVHAARVAADPKLTVRQETVDDAVAAAGFLAAQPEVDPKRMFVVGHSLGAYVAPRIAAHYKTLAGIVVMAGNTRPLEDLVVEQLQYVLPLQIPDAEKAKAAIDAVRKQVAELKALEPGVGSKLVILGMPAHYLVDLRGYDPAAEARKLGLPVLVLQGERDYQVTMQDFAAWRKALDGHKLATLKSYPSLNHLFVEGQGKSTPFEYQKPGHVAAAVIEDIAAWIQASK